MKACSTFTQGWLFQLFTFRQPRHGVKKEPRKTFYMWIQHTARIASRLQGSDLKQRERRPPPLPPLSSLPREVLSLQRNIAADCLQRWEIVCIGSKTSWQQVHIWADAHIWWREVIKGVGIKGMGLSHDLLPSLLERLGRDEAARERWKGQELSQQCSGNPTELIFLIQSPNPRKIHLLTCLAGVQLLRPGDSLRETWSTGGWQGPSVTEGEEH